MTTPSKRLQVFYDMTRTVQSGGRMAGAVRVESEFASALLGSHADTVIPITWSSSAGHFLELDASAAMGYLSGAAGAADVAGPPVEAIHAPDLQVRRVIVVTGAGWLSNLALLHGLIRLRRALGAELHVVVHDLVHLRFPQWAPRDEALKAASAHEAILSTADRVLVYSESTARDVLAASAERGLKVNDIGSIALGTAFVPVQPRPSGLEALTDRPFVLFVSSVATRKNHQFIAEVWSRMTAVLGPDLPRLLFVGRAAPDQKDTLERLRRNPVLEDHLIHVSAASDEQLAWLYERCLFTVFPSLYEGWGLPVAESLAFGKVCLASNASSIPEAAGGVTPLLDPLDITAWCEAIRVFVCDRVRLAAAEERVRRQYRPVTWSDASVRLWNAVVAPLEHLSTPPSLSTNAETQSLAALSVTRQPWRPLRDGLGLITAHQARTGVLLGDLPPHGLRLSVTMRNDDDEPVRVESNVNGAVLDSCTIGARETGTGEFDLPRDALLFRGLLDITTICKTTAEAPALAWTTVAATPLSASEESAAVEARRHAWRIGDALHFAVGSRHIQLLRDGWDQPAPWGTWTVKPSAALHVRPVPLPLDPIELTAIVRGFVPPQQPTLDVDVYVGATRVTTWVFAHPTDFTFVERRVIVPPDLIDDGWIKLTFAIPNARSPRDLGMGQDERALGIGLVRIHGADARSHAR